MHSAQGCSGHWVYRPVEAWHDDASHPGVLPRTETVEFISKIIFTNVEIFSVEWALFEQLFQEHSKSI